MGNFLLKNSSLLWSSKDDSIDSTSYSWISSMKIGGGCETCDRVLEREIGRVKVEREDFRWVNPQSHESEIVGLFIYQF